MNKSARRYREYKHKLEEGYSDYSTDDREVLEEAYGDTIVDKASAAVSSIGDIGSKIKSWFGGSKKERNAVGKDEEALNTMAASGKKLTGALNDLKPFKAKHPGPVNSLIKTELDHAGFNIDDISAAELGKAATESNDERPSGGGGARGDGGGERGGRSGAAGRATPIASAISASPIPAANALADITGGEASEAKAAVKSGEDAVAEFIAKGVNIPNVDKAKAAKIISALIQTDSLKIKLENRHFMSNSDFQILRESNKKMDRWLQLAGLSRSTLLESATDSQPPMPSARPSTKPKPPPLNTSDTNNSAAASPGAPKDAKSGSGSKAARAELTAAIADKAKVTKVLKILKGVDEKITIGDVLAVFIFLKPKLAAVEPPRVRVAEKQT